MQSHTFQCIVHDTFGACVNVQSQRREVQQTHRVTSLDDVQVIVLVKDGECEIALNGFSHAFERIEVQTALLFDKLNGNVLIGFDISFSFRRLGTFIDNDFIVTNVADTSGICERQKNFHC